MWTRNLALPNGDWTFPLAVKDAGDGPVKDAGDGPQPRIRTMSRRCLFLTHLVTLRTNRLRGPGVETQKPNDHRQAD